MIQTHARRRIRVADARRAPMNAKEAIDAFDRECEADTRRRLEHAEAQRYGEVPVVEPM